MYTDSYFAMSVHNLMSSCLLGWLMMSDCLILECIFSQLIKFIARSSGISFVDGMTIFSHKLRVRLTGLQNFEISF